MATLSPEGLSALLEKFQGKRLLVVGDFLVSRFVEVSARKLAREAPVPAGDLVGETLVPGGAANLANEVASMGGQVSAIGVVGDDNYGSWLKEDLARNGVATDGIVVDKSRPTSLRTWIMVNHLHFLRIDQEVRKEVQAQVTKSLATSAEGKIPGVDTVVFSDYDRGVVTSSLISTVVASARKAGKIVVAQPKDRHYLDFSGVTYVKSNLSEALHATQMAMVNETSLRNMGVHLMGRLDCKGLVITKGEEGMTVFDREQITSLPLPFGRKSFFNKVGVRDTMTGVFSLAVAAGGSITEAACLSNIAGAVRSEKPRTSTLTVQDMEKRLETMGDFLNRVSQMPVRR
ncbi:MAG TPA: PfkB family carbohydrate kinase [Nitrososphaerales archaeon]|nr:PfkB family carbohydrate kinase [Nitrososphaerales archaeon]